ncbi:MAG TPA: tetratricopeptide repeat protein [Candidatus Cryosericum sp.]|nr:tetratricopeptide repeat protein [Candidatus Cryosericum sp.]
MKIRTVLYLTIGAIVVAVLSILYTTNREVLDRHIFFGHGLSMPVWSSILLACGISMLVPLLFGLLRDLRRFFANLTVRQRQINVKEAEQLYLKGIEAMLNGREERALEHFNAVIEIDPAHFEALLKGGEVLRTLRRYAEAIEYHRRAARDREGDLRPLYQLVADYEESGASENAKASLNRIIELNPKRSLNAYRQFRAICIREGSWDKAWGIQQKIEELLTGMGRSSKAEKKYHLAIRYNLAIRHLEEGRPREAIGILRRLVRVDPAFVPAHLRLGRALLAIGQPEAAVEVWEEGHQATGHPILLTTIEDHYLREEQPRRAIEALKAAVWKSRNDVLPRFFLGKLYFRLEMLDEALAEFSRMKAQVTYFPALHYCLAKIQERHGNYREALRELETLLLQAEALKVEYACGTCSRRYPAWVEHCERCGEWNSVVVDFREERGVEELGLSTAPVYTVDNQD